VIALFAALLGCSEGITLSDAQKDDVRELADAARTMNEPLEVARKQAILYAHGHLGPRPDLGRCTTPIRRPATDDIGTFADENITFALGSAPISVVPAADLDKSEGPRWDRVQNAIVNDVEAMLIGAYRAEDFAEIDHKFEHAKALSTLEWLPADATLVIDRLVPARIDGTSFTTGLLEGRMYVYDYRTAQIVCAATVRAGNSDTLGVHMHLDDDNKAIGAQSDADRDLYMNSVLMGLDGLAAVGPLVFAIDP
jgi:hypothetical protein